MEIITKKKKIKGRSWLYVHPCGELDMDSADEFKTAITEGLLKYGCRMVELDMSAVTFIDSSGLGVIMGRYRELAPVDGKIIITGANEQVCRLLIASGLQRIIEIKKEESIGEDQ